MEPRRRDHVDTAAQQLLQIGNEPAREPRRRVFADLDKKIDVALRPGITSGDGTEYADARNAMLRGNPKNVIAFAGEDFVDSHIAYKNRGYFFGIASCINSYTHSKIVSRFGFDQ